MDKLIIFDTTLRDGEQSPGASMTRAQKLKIARALQQLRVDVIEAGFPIASPDEFAAVREISAAVTDCAVCGLARALERDIDRAAEALAPAARPRIHTFIATSPIHMRQKLRMSEAQVLEHAAAAVRRARRHTDDVEFSPEDAGRSDRDFLCRVVEAAIAAGARTINVPDTVGYSMPFQFGGLIGELLERVPNADRAVFSVHCHNDLGLAVANSLDAVRRGARQVECTLNGLGERAGNAALEEVVMAVRTRRDVFDCDTGVDATQIVPTSRLVSSVTGFPVQPNKAIVGANAFAHESGIHQDGVLKYRETYEIMRAQDVGWASNRIVLGKHSGRRAVREALETLGLEVPAAELDGVFARFKELADRKHEIVDDDLVMLVLEGGDAAPADAEYQLADLEVRSKLGATPVAQVVLRRAGREYRGEAAGSGPVDASFRAIEDIVGTESELQLYSVNSITSGTDAQGEVTVRLRKGDAIVNGQGAHTDIVIASARAYLNAVGKLASEAARMHPQLDHI